MTKVINQLYHSDVSSSNFSIESLGAATPTPSELHSLVADQIGRPVESLRDVRVSPVDYHVPAITTAARWWVRGVAATSTGETSFAFFVKVVQAWSRSPVFQQVPEAFRAGAAAGFPWRTEALIYRSDVAAKLPAGLRMAPCHGVIDLDEESYAVWLGEVPVIERAWTAECFSEAAYLLGRVAGSAELAELAGVGGFSVCPSDYLRGRLAMQVVPILRSELWQHPLLREAFDDDLHRRIDAVLDRVDDLGAELDAVARTTTHGDATPGNLLSTADDGFVMIDFGFWTPLPVGFGLGQLLVGDVVLGHRPAAGLAATDAVIVPAYLAGLRAEGVAAEVASERTVWRAHALELLIFRGLSAMPFDLLDAAPDTVMAAARERAGLTTYCLDLLDATA